MKKFLPPHKDRTPAEWLIERRAAGNSAIEARLQEWFDKDPEHEAAYEKYENAVELTRALKNDAETKAYFDEVQRLLKERASESSQKEIQSPHRAWLRSRWLAAASVALMAVGLVAALVNREDAYETNIGEQRTVVLADESAIKLNTDTKLLVDYSKTARHVALKQGEAYFSVAKDSIRPFEVAAGSGLIRAVGTAFAVTVNNDQITVAVLEGVVKVKPNRSGSAQNTPEEYEVSRGESITYWESGATAQVVAADARRINAWRAGKLDFDSARLADAIAEYNRYTKKKILIGNDQIKEVAVSGVFDIGDTPAFLFLLQHSLNLKITEHPGAIVLLPQESA